MTLLQQFEGWILGYIKSDLPSVQRVPIKSSIKIKLIGSAIQLLVD